MENTNSKRIRFFLAAGLIVVVCIAGIVLVNQHEKARTEEQREAISEVIPDIDERDMEYLMSRNIYAAYGQVQKNQDLMAILDSASEGFEEKHLYHPDGPIFGHGVNYLDCIEIYLHEEFPVTDETTDEIYQVIESHARPPGTNDTPVIFIRAGLINLDGT
ncbi:hypothetical protein J2129_002110 [Methanofollis sp. W23]|uniref:hypothetical protein n=1 Tax=Methanofollis sp. W23 TaxID=2817849 RepID=UPI001AE63CF8|nr:hypothetical protein [Methanofollis sp. W23]MBP2146656.1 hypothetical protein [Methanofollis sp. W23]